MLMTIRTNLFQWLFTSIINTHPCWVRQSTTHRHPDPLVAPVDQRVIAGDSRSNMWAYGSVDLTSWHGMVVFHGGMVVVHDDGMVVAK